MELSAAFVSSCSENFLGNPLNRIVQNAVNQVPIDDIALNRDCVIHTQHNFSHTLHVPRVTNQKSSGRCWIFAALNSFRFNARSRLEIDDFEYSQNYVMFWDKMERANFFLDSILKTATLPLEDRTVQFLLHSDNLASDGGQWDMLAATVLKHGLVPKACMPETESSSATSKMNGILRTKLREAAKMLRQLVSEGKCQEEVNRCREEYLQVIYRILCIHLGNPPTTINFQYMNSGKKFQRMEPCTPVEFVTHSCSLPIADYVCLIHDPRPSSILHRTYTVAHLGSVIGGHPVKYFTVTMDMLKNLTKKTITEKGEPVWFGCDVGKSSRCRDYGILSTDLYRYSDVYQTTFDLTKAEKLLYGHMAMTHAMLFTGVDIVDDLPRRWRVENSWGEDSPKESKGFLTMSDQWFEEYVMEVAIRKDIMPPELQSLLDMPPIVLPPWDPYGTLANN